MHPGDSRRGTHLNSTCAGFPCLGADACSPLRPGDKIDIVARELCRQSDREYSPKDAPAHGSIICLLGPFTDVPRIDDVLAQAAE